MRMGSTRMLELRYKGAPGGGREVNSSIRGLRSVKTAHLVRFVFPPFNRRKTRDSEESR